MNKQQISKEVKKYKDKSIPPISWDWLNIFLQVACLMIILRFRSHNLGWLGRVWVIYLYPTISVNHREPGPGPTFQFLVFLRGPLQPESGVLPYGIMALVTNWRSITITPGSGSHQLSSLPHHYTVHQPQHVSRNSLMSPDVTSSSASLILTEPNPFISKLSLPDWNLASSQETDSQQSQPSECFVTPVTQSVHIFESLSYF